MSFQLHATLLFILQTLLLLLLLLAVVVQGFNVAGPSTIQKNLLTSSTTNNAASTLTFLRSYHEEHHSSLLVATSIRQTTQLQMGLFDFFDSRGNDFVKLEKTSTFGPGPVVLLYNVPDGILDEEIRDMIDDGIPSSKPGEVKFSRFKTCDLDSIGTKTVQQVLDDAISSSSSQNNGVVVGGGGGISHQNDESYIPILYFSGVSNSEMMQTYNIIGREIYEESGGLANAACAKAVEPAMEKSFRQLLEEISGDHSDAIQT